MESRELKNLKKLRKAYKDRIKRPYAHLEFMGDPKVHKRLADEYMRLDNAIKEMEVKDECKIA